LLAKNFIEIFGLWTLDFWTLLTDEDAYTR